jgi:hypothetical protein
LVGGFLKGLAEGLTALGTTKVLKGVLALAGIAGALWITGKAVNEFVTVKWDDMGKAGAALLALSAAGRIIGNAGPQIIKGAIAIGIMGASLWVVGKAVQEFVGLDWKQLELAAAAITGLGVAGFAIGKYSMEIGKGVIALGLMGAALWVVGKAVQEFVGLDWKQLELAGAALVGIATIAGIMGIPVVAAAIATGTGLLLLLSGALWAFGKAAISAAPGLKALAQSFMEFGKIDGKNLVLVAGGIMALTGALIAFAAGGIASGVGNTVGSITDGISKLFGGDSILGKLKEFAAIGPGLSLLASSLGIVGTSVNIMTSALNAFTGLDKLQSIISAINTLDPKKAAAFGNLGNAKAVSLPNLTPTSNLSISKSPRLSTLNSPSAIVTTPSSINQANKDKEINNSTGPGIEKASSETNINSILDYQNILLQQLVSSTENLVSVNRDILKYTRANV